jgi:hypothetical protein
LWYDAASRHGTGTVPEFRIGPMKSHWLSVCLVAAVAFLPLTRATSEEPGEAPAPDPMGGKEPGEVLDDNGLKMKLVWCPPGKFVMDDRGDAEEGVIVELTDG